MRIALVPSTVVVLLLAGAAGGATTPSPVLHTSEPVTTLAMDGSRVAYATQQTGGCPHLSVWTLPHGGVVRLSGQATCGPGATSTGGGVRELALAGTRAAWTSNFGGNTESNDILLTAALPRPHEKVLSRAHRTGDVDGVLSGAWVGGLAGDGSLLVYSRWTTDDAGATTAGNLRRIRGVSTSLLSGGRGAVVSRSVSSGRVAVVAAGGEVGVYGAGGRAVASVRPPSVKAVALAGNRLVVLSKQSTLFAYDARDGRLLHTFPVAGGASPFLDASGNVAVYASWRTLHALRLDTGRDVVLERQARAIVAAQIEPSGVAWAWNGFARGRFVGNVAYLPAAAVAAAVGTRP